VIEPTEILLHIQVVHETLRQTAMAHAQEKMACGHLRDCRNLRAVDRVRFAGSYLARLLAVLLPRWPRVSVVTPTWQRRGLLLERCIPSVQAQEYQGSVEHVIVSDGPDPTLPPLGGMVMLREHEPGRNRGLRARDYGTQLADGDVIAYLDDDNAWRPRHLAVLVRALLDSDADFAYSRAMCSDGTFGYSIGISPPTYAQIDTSLIVHRRELLGKARWQESDEPADWNIVRRWLGVGAKWAFVPEITLDYYVGKT
jgi:glycosyltransferase involved in cell wall biosynthesis